MTTYFKTAQAENKNPAPGYAAGGRGYPDISLAGANYFIWMLRRDQPNGFLGGVAGTSASCPVAAAFISNINAGRIAAGKGSIGWLNPTLNLYYADFTNDVTVGNNNCVIGGPPCNTGYTATTGWDPASGFGSVDYARMHAKLVGLGNGLVANTPPTQKPNAAPTLKPSSSLRLPQPVAGYKMPTYKPTYFPTRRRKSSVRFPAAVTKTVQAKVAEPVTVFAQMSTYIEHAVSVLYSPFAHYTSASKSSLRA